MTHRLYVGTIGEGLFRSLDAGQSFRRACDGMFVECDVRALLVHPRDDATLYLGSELGVFVSRDGADSWTRLSGLGGGEQVWSLWLQPGRPEVMLAGLCPSGVWRSENGGASWAGPATNMRRDCPRILHTRLTCFTSDPEEPAAVFAGVEIDGIHVSRDAGLSWQRIGSGLSSQDIHALAAFTEGNRKVLVATTNEDANRSDDGGLTWQPLRVGRSLPWQYTRGLAQKVGSPRTLFLGTGDGPPGSEGAVALSQDGGLTWELARLPGRANSTIWNFATHPSNPERVYASSVSGQVYRSEDGGASWEKLAREFGEIRALAWTP